MFLWFCFRFEKSVTSSVKKIFEFCRSVFILLLFSLSIIWITFQTCFGFLLNNDRRGNSNLVFLISWFSHLPLLALSESFSVFHFVAVYWLSVLTTTMRWVLWSWFYFSGVWLFKQVVSSLMKILNLFSR